MGKGWYVVTFEQNGNSSDNTFHWTWWGAHRAARLTRRDEKDKAAENARLGFGEREVHVRRRKVRVRKAG